MATIGILLQRGRDILNPQCARLDKHCPIKRDDKAKLGGVPTLSSHPRRLVVLDPPRHPVCRRPALLWSGPPPGPPRQDGLDARTDAGGPGGGLLGSPGSTVGGMASHPQPPTGRKPPADPRPSWSRSAPAGGAVTAAPPTTRQPPTDPACVPLGCAVLAARPGRLPAHHPNRQRPVVIRRPTGLPALRASRRACCVAGVGASAERRARALAAARAARQGPP